MPGRMVAGGIAACSPQLPGHGPFEKKRKVLHVLKDLPFPESLLQDKCLRYSVVQDGLR